MGLAASQARLLMLTARKDDIEGQLMRLANTKLTMARRSAAIAREYTDALNTQKLMFNNGTKDVDVTYGNLVNANAQCMITNSYGAVVLNDGLWSALGSPADGSQISNSDSNAKAFIAKAAGVSENSIDLSTLKSNTAPQKNDKAAPVPTKEVTYSDSDIFGYLNDKYQANAEAPMKDFFGNDHYYSPDGITPNSGGANTASFCFWQGTSGELDNQKSTIATALKGGLNTMMDDASEALKSLPAFSGLSIDSYIALAKKETTNYFVNQLMTNVIVDGNENEYWETAKYANNSCNIFDNGVGGDNDSNKHELIIDPNQVIKLFLNFFDDACNGSLNDSNVKDYYKKDQQTTSRGIKDHYQIDGHDRYYNFKKVDSVARDGDNGEDVVIHVPTTGSTDKTTPTPATPAQAMAYYYGLFQQICQNGWVHDSAVGTNKDYLQGQIQGGCYYVDHYSNGAWSNYSLGASDSPITSQDDEAAQKQAEAKRDADKDEIDYKEKIIDVTMNDLDTERQATTTDIDSVKKIIDKNMDMFKFMQQG